MEYTWGKDTCPFCEGIQSFEKNFYGGNYKRWHCSTCGNIENDLNKTIRLAHNRPDLLDDTMRKLLGV
ncbi:MAG: hypothetical protein WC389_16965 [Lutibacter sp.]|jgi:transposase-like protein